MTRKYCTPHPERGRSRYRLRLQNRGYGEGTRGPRMDTLASLQAKHARVFPLDILGATPDCGPHCSEPGPRETHCSCDMCHGKPVR